MSILCYRIPRYNVDKKVSTKICQCWCPPIDNQFSVFWMLTDGLCRYLTTEFVNTMSISTYRHWISHVDSLFSTQVSSACRKPTWVLCYRMCQCSVDKKVSTFHCPCRYPPIDTGLFSNFSQFAVSLCSSYRIQSVQCILSFFSIFNITYNRNKFHYQSSCSALITQSTYSLDFVVTSHTATKFNLFSPPCCN